MDEYRHLNTRNPSRRLSAASRISIVPNGQQTSQSTLRMSVAPSGQRRYFLHLVNDL